MVDFLDKYGQTLLIIITGVFSIGLLFSIFYNPDVANSKSMNSLSQEVTTPDVPYEVPYVEPDDFEVTNAILSRNSTFNWKDYVSVHASNGLDLINYVTTDGEVDTSTTGAYPVFFNLNFNGKEIIKRAVFYVREAT